MVERNFPPTADGAAIPSGSAVVFPASFRRKFVAAVSNAVSQLMSEHGYSRERATIAVLKEITANSSTGTDKDNSNSTSQAAASGDLPRDDEIFRYMRRHGLGSQQVRRALNVSASVELKIRDGRLSVVEAVEDMIRRISEARTLTQHGEHDIVSEPVQGVPVAQPNPSREIRPPPSQTAKLERSSSLSKQHQEQRPKPVSSAKKPKSAVKSGKTKNKEPAGSVKLGRKRSIEESPDVRSTPQQPEPSRPRCDSVTELVSAKFGGAENHGATREHGVVVDRQPPPSTSSSTAVTATPVNAAVRKRGRSCEDVDAAPGASSSVKRARQS